MLHPWSSVSYDSPCYNPLLHEPWNFYYGPFGAYLSCEPVFVEVVALDSGEKDGGGG